jgi:hypothetical protein
LPRRRHAITLRRMAADDIILINAALTRAGIDPITAYDDGSNEAVVAEANYEELIRAEISGHPWRWATKTQALNLLEGSPAVGGRFAWQLPGDVLLLQAVWHAGCPVRAYQVLADKIACDVDEDITAVYLWRPPEADWPGYFSEAVRVRLEALFLRALAEKHGEADARDSMAERKFAWARSRDSQTQPGRDPWRSALVMARYG